MAKSVAPMTQVLGSAGRRVGTVGVAYPSKSLTWKTRKNLGMAIGGAWATATLLHIGFIFEIKVYEGKKDSGAHVCRETCGRCRPSKSLTGRTIT